MTDLKGLNPDTQLRRASQLRLHIDSSNLVEVILAEGRRINCGPRGMAVLDVFHQPTSFRAALDKLQPFTRGVEDVMNVVSTIVELYNAGVLLDERQEGEKVAAPDGGWNALAPHRSMLNDRGRTSGYMEAIQRGVRPGDVVVDLGTGTGVLAIAAARAGAHHVYAIEASGIAGIARAVIEANGLAERITVVRGWSSQIDLPEPADVLVSEIIGNEPLGERVLEATLDARRRLLKPGARLIPERLTIFGVAVAMSEGEPTEIGLSSGTLHRWMSWYGVDFSALSSMQPTDPELLVVEPSEAREWPALSPPVVLADLDLAKLTGFQVKNIVETTADKDGSIGGVLLYFEADLGGSLSLSTDPVKIGSMSSWKSAAWRFNEPIRVDKGDTLRISYRYRVPGEPHGVRLSKV